VTLAPGALAARAHPFTPLALTLCLAVIAVALPGPAAAASLYAATLLVVLTAGTGRAALRALVPLAPLWLFLFLLHGVLGDGGRVTVLGVSLSRDGLILAATASTNRARAASILEAQRSRGLRLRGSPLNRVRALGPIMFPLLLGVLAEVDERGFALETRCASGVKRRTALAPPSDTLADGLVRWGGAAAAAAAIVWRALA
jgi:energy-coupling factor transporter transmembrane protein EcfT